MTTICLTHFTICPICEKTLPSSDYFNIKKCLDHFSYYEGWIHNHLKINEQEWQWRSGTQPSMRIAEEIENYISLTKNQLRRDDDPSFYRYGL